MSDENASSMGGIQERAEVYFSMLKLVLFVVALFLSSKIIDMWKGSMIDMVRQGSIFSFNAVFVHML